jgi:hypothetical protein
MTWYRSAVAPFVTHLATIKTLRYPNRDPRNTTCGTNSHQIESQSFSCKKLSRLMKIPSVICVMPIRMDIFIFSELTNKSSVFVPCHTGSTPTAYGVSAEGTSPDLNCETHKPESWKVGSFGSQPNLERPNSDIGTEKHSLYSNPV